MCKCIYIYIYIYIPAGRQRAQACTPAAHPPRRRSGRRRRAPFSKQDRIQFLVRL